MDGGDFLIIILPAGDAAGVIVDIMLMIERAPPADGVGEEGAGNRRMQAPYLIQLPLAQSDDFRMLQHIGDGQTRRILDVPVAEEKKSTMEPEMPLDVSRKVKRKGRHFQQSYYYLLLLMVLTLERCN